MAGAEAIIARPGLTEGVAWEIETALARHYRLLLYIPSEADGLARAKFAARFRHRYRHVFPGGLPRRLARHTFVAFDSTGRSLTVEAEVPWWRNTWPVGHQNTTERHLIAAMKLLGIRSRQRDVPWIRNLAVNAVVIPVFIVSGMAIIVIAALT